MSWTFYPVFIGTLISVVGLTRIALKNHDIEQPRTLSELAAAEGAELTQFRNILIVCDALFAATVFGFIVPRISHPATVAIFGIMMIGGELLVSLIPARDKTLKLHYISAQIMAVGMLGLALSFSLGLHRYQQIEVASLFLMCALAVLTLINKKRYLVYELAYIYFSHLTIVVAAIALR